MVGVPQRHQQDLRGAGRLQRMGRRGRSKQPLQKKRRKTSVLKVLPSRRRPPASLCRRLELSTAVHSGSPGLISPRWRVIQQQRRETMWCEHPLVVGELNFDLALLMSVSLGVMEQQEQQ